MINFRNQTEAQIATARALTARPVFGMAHPASLGRLGRWVALCVERSRQRRRLAELDARLLDDIGKTPSEALSEAAKLPWQP